MRQGSLRFSEADKQYVAACIGRTPTGVVGVAARDDTNNPAVIINLPLIPCDESWQPFPTLYWLVDPVLNAIISDIERKGGVRDIEQALTNAPDLMQAHRADNEFYARARWAVLNPKEKQAAKDLGMQPMLENTGIGGVANHDTIKCLHAQYAFHLARHDTGTTAGRLMHEIYNI